MQNPREQNNAELGETEKLGIAILYTAAVWGVMAGGFVLLIIGWKRFFPEYVARGLIDLLF